MFNDMLGRPGDELLGLVQDLIIKIRNGSITEREAKRFLRREDPWTLSVNDLSIFASIQVGFVSGFHNLGNELVRAGCDNGHEVAKLLGWNGIRTIPCEIDLVAVSVADLGFKNGERAVRMYPHAQAIGLELCPNDTAAQLVLQHTRIAEEKIGENALSLRCQLKMIMDTIVFSVWVSQADRGLLVLVSMWFSKVMKPFFSCVRAKRWAPDLSRQSPFMIRLLRCFFRIGRRRLCSSNPALGISQCGFSFWRVLFLTNFLLR